LRKLLVDRVLTHLRAIGELGLASVVSAGVAACGGDQLGSNTHDNDGGTTSDSSADHGPIIEAVSDGGPIVEAVSDAERPIDGGVCNDCDASADTGFDGGFDGGDANEDSPVIVEVATDGGHH